MNLSFQKKNRADKDPSGKEYTSNVILKQKKQKACMHDSSQNKKLKFKLLFDEKHN